MNNDQFKNSQNVNELFQEGQLHDHISTVSTSTVMKAVMALYTDKIQENYTIKRLTPTADGKDFIVEFEAIPAFAKRK